MVKFSMQYFPNVFVICASFIFMPLSQAFANSQEYGVEVQGRASVLVEPDVFALSIAITEKGRLTDKIRAIVDDKSNQVIQVARELGITANNINSARVSLRVIKKDPRIERQDLKVNQTLPNNQKSKVHLELSPNKQGSANNIKPQYFELSRNITVNFSDIKDYDQFLNKIIKIGVSQISPLTMSVGDTDKYYQQALAQAFNDAKIKAQQLANQADQRLGKLLYVKELSSNRYRTQMNSVMMSASASFEHDSHLGNQAINASVLVKYAIE